MEDKKMTKNKYIGSSFESFLEAEGIFEEVNAAAIKSVIADGLKKYMLETDATQEEMAKKLKTSRSGLLRLLDPNNYSVTLLTLNRVASILGKKITIELTSDTITRK